MDDKVIYIFDDQFKDPIKKQQIKIKIIFFTSIALLFIEALLIVFLYTLNMHLFWLILTIFLYCFLGWINIYQITQNYFPNRQILLFIDRTGKQNLKEIYADKIYVKDNKITNQGFTCYEVVYQSKNESKIIYALDKANFQFTEKITLYTMDSIIIAYRGEHEHA